MLKAYIQLLPYFLILYPLKVLTVINQYYVFPSLLLPSLENRSFEKSVPSFTVGKRFFEVFQTNQIFIISHLSLLREALELIAADEGTLVPSLVTK